MARFIFIVQGEGRGHMSQAMAMVGILEKNGHRVETMFVGKSPLREIPGYFIQFGKEILETFRSPNFIRKPDNKGILLWKTFIYNLLRAFLYRKEINRLRESIIRINPDCVINFYDLVGSYVLEKLPGHIRKICISHHFYLTHKDFQFPKNKRFHRYLLSRLNQRMQAGCDRVAALSFRPGEHDGRVTVIPPLIRKDFVNLHRSPGKRDLVYLLHTGYVADMVAMALEDPTFEADIFIDTPLDYEIPSNIKVYNLDPQLFREKMQVCKRLITTAGFDTIAEAALLGIPVIACPVKNHFEQLCNAIDMEKAGFGIRTGKFTLDVINSVNSYNNQSYLEWLQNSENLVLQLIEK